MAKKNKKPKDKIRAKMKAKKAKDKEQQNKILFVCNSCGKEEFIPKDVVEYFDTMDDGDIFAPPTFSCENCSGIMYPKEYAGVHGVSYTID